MKSYIALISLDLRLAVRQKSVIFFNYLLPLVFFFVFAKASHAERGSEITKIIAMVTVIGTLGSGLFGAGMRAVQEREANILRRYKVTPISPLPLLVASVFTGWVLFMPNILLMLCLAHFMYGMPWPSSPVSLFVFISFGIAAFRSLGLILASIANSMQESQILIQLVYLPLLFLSGATFPISMFPAWLQTIAGFIPTTYLVIGVQSMLLQGKEGLDWNATFALLITTAVGLFIALKLFRWEKDEKVKTSSKLWLVAVMLPFLAMGAWQAHTKTGITENKILSRKMSRGQTRLIRGARIFVGDGKVIENGSVLIRDGKIAAIYDGQGPSPESLKADVEEAAGKTILPGLIDVHVHLGAEGGFHHETTQDYNPHKVLSHALAAYLYSGVTTVRSTGDMLDAVKKIGAQTADGEILGAQVQTCGPLFTTKGGHGTEYFKFLPENVRESLQKEFTRIPSSADDAKQQVDGVKTAGGDCIKAVLESGVAGHVFNRMDTGLFNAVAAEAHAQGLPLAVHTGEAIDVADAVHAQANSIEHGSLRDAIPDAVFDAMAHQGTFYDPTLSVAEAFNDFAAGKGELLKRSLVQQVASEDLRKGTEEALTSKDMEETRRVFGAFAGNVTIANDNLKRAYQHGVALVTGSDAGNTLVIHGPTVQHEMALWVKAGIPPAVALQAATYNAARLMNADNHIGSIRVGNDADLLIVDGNPLEDISVMERISFVVLKGERIERSELFDQH